MKFSRLILSAVILSGVGYAYADWDSVGDAPSGTHAMAVAGFQWLSNFPHLLLTTDTVWSGAKYNNIGTWGVGANANTGNIVPNFCVNGNLKFVLSTTTGTLANPTCVNEGQTVSIIVQQNSAVPPPLSGASDLITSYGTYYHFAAGTKPTLSVIPNQWDLIQCATVLSPSTTTLIGVCAPVINVQ